MRTQEIPVAGKSNINISMSEEAIGIDEVVAIGYGTQKKKDITSAIAVVNSQDMARTPVANVVNALEGLSPGVEVQSNQGKPGTEADVRIRGVSSISGATEPLYVIDGIPQSGAYVNSADVESIQVLKDAASSAIYGSRGANGVIIITTKSGKTGAPKVNYSGYYGLEKAWKQIGLLNTKQWAELAYESNIAGGATPPPLAVEIHDNPNGPWADWNGKETNWQDSSGV